MTLDMIAPKMRSESEAECEGFAFFIGIPTGNSGYFWQYPGVDVSEPNLRGLRRRASCVLPMMRASCVGPSPLSILASSAPRRPLIGIDPSLQQQRGSSGLGRVTGQSVGVFLAPFAPPPPSYFITSVVFLVTFNFHFAAQDRRRQKNSHQQPPRSEVKPFREDEDKILTPNTIKNEYLWSRRLVDCRHFR